MKQVRPFRLLGLLALGLLAMSRPAFAQSNDEVFPQFQWNFATPGARANAMGRAFIGLADDASAAISNPAGLLQLTKRQAYFEFKNTDLQVTRLAMPTSFFTPFPATTVSTRVSVPSFMSFSMPVNSRLAIAVTRHEYLAYRETFSLQPRVVPNPPQTPNLTLFPVNGTASFTAASYAGSVAYAVNDKLRVGATVALDHLSATSQATRFDVGTGPTFNTNKFDVIVRTVGNPATPLIVNQTSINSGSSGLSLVFGGLYTVNEKVSVGASYVMGSSLSVIEDLKVNPGRPPNPTAGDTNQTLTEFTGFPKTVPINVPDRFGAGVAIRPNSRALVSVDVLRIGYSSLAKDFVIVLDPGKLSGSQFTIPNVVEIHAGGEYLIVTGPHPIFLRGGIFTAPDHSTKYTSNAASLGTDSDASFQALYNLLPRKTSVVGSVGVGFVFGKRGQADVALVGLHDFVASVGARF